MQGVEEEKHLVALALRFSGYRWLIGRLLGHESVGAIGVVERTSES
jgi:hypothetical protein